MQKPTKRYHDVVEKLQKLLDLLIGQLAQYEIPHTLSAITGLRTTRQEIPRTETVSPFLNERRDLVGIFNKIKQISSSKLLQISCICVSLFACEHAFRARAPLPQFIPSAKSALTVLEARTEQRIRTAREERHALMGLSLTYAFAEAEILKDIVDALEDLLELSQQLFGSSAWLHSSMSTPSASLIDDGPGDSWFSTLRPQNMRQGSRQSRHNNAMNA